MHFHFSSLILSLLLANGCVKRKLNSPMEVTPASDIKNKTEFMSVSRDVKSTFRLVYDKSKKTEEDPDINRISKMVSGLSDEHVANMLNSPEMKSFYEKSSSRNQNSGLSLTGQNNSKEFDKQAMLHSGLAIGFGGMVFASVLFRDKYRVLKKTDEAYFGPEKFRQAYLEDDSGSILVREFKKGSMEPVKAGGKVVQVDYAGYFINGKDGKKIIVEWNLDLKKWEVAPDLYRVKDHYGEVRIVDKDNFLMQDNYYKVPGSPDSEMTPLSPKESTKFSQTPDKSPKIEIEELPRRQYSRMEVDDELVLFDSKHQMFTLEKNGGILGFDLKPDYDYEYSKLIKGTNGETFLVFKDSPSGTPMIDTKHPLYERFGQFIQHRDGANAGIVLKVDQSNKVSFGIAVSDEFRDLPQGLKYDEKTGFFLMDQDGFQKVVEFDAEGIARPMTVLHNKSNIEVAYDGKKFFNPTAVDTKNGKVYQVISYPERTNQYLSYLDSTSSNGYKVDSMFAEQGGKSSPKSPVTDVMDEMVEDVFEEEIFFRKGTGGDTFVNKSGNNISVNVEELNVRTRPLIDDMDVSPRQFSLDYDSMSMFDINTQMSPTKTTSTLSSVSSPSKTFTPGPSTTTMSNSPTPSNKNTMTIMEEREAIVMMDEMDDVVTLKTMGTTSRALLYGGLTGLAAVAGLAAYRKFQDHPEMKKSLKLSGTSGENAQTRKVNPEIVSALSELDLKIGQLLGSAGT